MTDLKDSKFLCLFSVLLPIFAVISFMLYELFAVTVGTPIHLTVEGYDPTDFLRGHYIRYDALVENLTILDPENQPDKYYTQLDGYIVIGDKDSDGIYDSFSGFSWEKPDSPYIYAFCRLFEDRHYIFLDNNQTRYYLDENLAPIAEKKILEEGSFTLVGTLFQGLFRASRLEVAGESY